MSDYDRRIIPPFVKVSKSERMVDPATLTVHQKQALWKGVKIDNPGLAELLKTDPNITALQQQFNAKVRFTVAEFNGYLQTGLKAFEESNHDRS